MLEIGNYVPSRSRGEFAIPMVEFEGYGRNIPISRLYQGIVMNLSNQAISTYSNFPFNSIACFNGKYFGATDTGIHELGGDYDNGVYINAKVKTGSMDFGDTVIKYARDVWITKRTKGHMEIVMLVDEDSSTSVNKQTNISGNEMHEERLKPPRGLRGRFYTVELKNLSGSDFDVDSFNMLVESIKRKVR